MYSVHLESIINGAIDAANHAALAQTGHSLAALTVARFVEVRGAKLADAALVAHYVDGFDDPMAAAVRLMLNHEAAELVAAFEADTNVVDATVGKDGAE